MLPNIHVHVLHASTRMDVTLHNTNIATLYAFIKRRHNMTSSYDWPCSLQIYSIQMPHARCRIRANIPIFCRQPRSPIKFSPHIMFTRIYSTHLRIYASTYLHFRRNHTRHTDTPPLPFQMPSTQQYSRAQQNRRNEQQRLRRARRNETLNCRRNSRDGRSRGGQIQEQHVTYVRSPNMSTSISQLWELPLLRPECNEEQRAFTLDARNDIINTAQRAANIIVDIASPCQHCGAHLFKGEFSNIAISRHISIKLSNSISPHADHLLSSVLIRHSLQL